jgi:hypothetical protein
MSLGSEIAEELYYKSIEKYINRLLEEWKQHGKIIIAVDWDDTLYPWRLHKEEDMKATWDLLKECKATGAYIVIFTACNTDRFKDIESYTKGKGLDIDSINTNPITLPYGNHSKVYANIFLDDRAGLNQSLEILSSALYKYRGYLQTKKELPDVA